MEFLSVTVLKRCIVKSMDIHLSIIVHCVNMPLDTVDVVLARQFGAVRTNGGLFSVKEKVARKM